MSSTRYAEFAGGYPVPQIDWTDIFYTLGPIEFAVAISIGVLVGYVFLSQWFVSIVDALWTLTIVGGVFFASEVTARWADGVPVWPRLIGIGLLWMVYVIASQGGIALRRAYDRTCTKES